MEPTLSWDGMAAVGVDPKLFLNFKFGRENPKDARGAREGGSHSPKLPDLIGAVTATRIPKFVPAKIKLTCWGSQKFLYKYPRSFVIKTPYSHFLLHSYSLRLILRKDSCFLS